MEFLNPIVFFVMIIPIAILLFLIGSEKSNLHHYFEEESLERLHIANNALSPEIRNVMFFIALILFVIALARPVSDKTVQKVNQNGANIVVALDISKSMLASDIYPNRLEFAKSKIKELINLQQGSKIAVIIFASSAYLISPLTSDSATSLFLLDKVNSDFISQGGTNLLSALNAATKSMEKSVNKSLIIFTDGGDQTNYDEEISKAKEDKLNVYVVNIGTTKGGPIKDGENFVKDKNGQIVIVKRNDLIKELALQTDGAYINADISNSDMQQLHEVLSTRLKNESTKVEDIVTYNELFIYPLALGLLFMILSTISLPKKKVALVLTFFSLSYNTTLEASLLDFWHLHEGKKAYENGEYNSAKSEFLGVEKSSDALSYNIGNSLYKDGKYKEAITQYEKIKEKDLEFEKLHNLGNAYAKLGETQKAIESYENALKIKDDEDTKYNLDILKKEEEKKEQQNQENDENNQNNGDKNQEQKEQNNQNNENKENNSENNENKNDPQEKEAQNQKEEQSKENQSSKQKEQRSQISELEEKKWMDKLEKKQQNILLYQIPNSEEYKSDTNW